jgi:hypothetical protein
MNDRTSTLRNQPAGNLYSVDELAKSSALRRFCLSADGAVGAAASMTRMPRKIEEAETAGARPMSYGRAAKASPGSRAVAYAGGGNPAHPVGGFQCASVKVTVQAVSPVEIGKFMPDRG